MDRGRFRKSLGFERGTEVVVGVGVGLCWKVEGPDDEYELCMLTCEKSDILLFVPSDTLFLLKGFTGVEYP